MTDDELLRAAEEARESFGYWAGPFHDYDGHGNEGAIPMVTGGRGITAIDHSGYDHHSATGNHTRRCVAGEW